MAAPDVLDDLDVLDNDKTLGDQLIEFLEKGTDARLSVDDDDCHGQIIGEGQDAGGVDVVGRAIAFNTTQLELPAGKLLTREGGRGDEFILVEQGPVEVRRGDRVIATCGPGEYVGEISLIKDRRRTATVVTKTPVVIDVIGRREFHGLMNQVPAVAEQVRMTAENRLREFENQLRA